MREGGGKKLGSLLGLLKIFYYQNSQMPEKEHNPLTTYLSIQCLYKLFSLYIIQVIKELYGCQYVHTAEIIWSNYRLFPAQSFI